MSNNVISINRKKFNDFKSEILLSEFDVNNYKNDIKNKRVGVAPFFSFSINDDISIGVEMVYSIEMFSNLKINYKEDVTEYITDILCDFGNGLLSIQKALRIKVEPYI